MQTVLGLIKRKKLIIFPLLLIVIIVIVIIIRGNGLSGKWYMMDDDDYWFEIHGNSIHYYSVQDDELIGQGKIRIDGDNLIVLEPDYHKYKTYILNPKTYKYRIDNDVLTLTGSYKGESYEMKYSRDKSYKHDW